MSIIIEDKNKIKTLWFPDESRINAESFDAIVPYHENGEMAPVVWFKVLKDNKVIRRINSKYVLEVEYEQLTPAKEKE